MLDISGKGFGRCSAKGHRKDNIRGLTKPAIRRGGDGGAKRRRKDNIHGIAKPAIRRGGNGGAKRRRKVVGDNIPTRVNFC
jgi:hypothetical protein